MVSGLFRSKNISKMKSPKSNSKTRRNRYSTLKDQPIKIQKKPLDSEIAFKSKKIKSDDKVKSGSWKRKSHSQIKTVDLDFPSPSSSFQPGILYSDVLFSGEKTRTLVNVKNVSATQVASHSHSSHSRSKKKRDKLGKQNGLKVGFESRPVKLEENTITPPTNANNLLECTKYLTKQLKIEIPSWNFEDFGMSNDFPRFTGQFDDYNYLALESVAFVGLRLASDGKFKS